MNLTRLLRQSADGPLHLAGTAINTGVALATMPVRAATGVVSGLGELSRRPGCR